MPWLLVNPRSYSSALSSPSTSLERLKPVAGVPRIESQYDSSPTIRPWTAVIPVAFSRATIRPCIVVPVPYQLWSKPTDPNVGSPPPRR